MKFTFDLPTSLWRISQVASWSSRVAPRRRDSIGSVPDWRFYHDVFVLMTACLQATTHLEVERLVTDPFVRHPSLMACAMATMNDLSRGRAVLGFGGGFGGGLEQPALWPHERSHPFKAVPDAVEISRGMFRGETVSHTGRVISVEGPKHGFPPFCPDLPVVIAARGKRMIDLAGERTASCISPWSF